MFGARNPFDLLRKKGKVKQGKTKTSDNLKIETSVFPRGAYEISPQKRETPFRVFRISEIVIDLDVTRTWQITRMLPDVSINVFEQTPRRSFVKGFLFDEVLNAKA